MSAPSLDGRTFVMESSTASEVDPLAPSRFLYSERDGVIWGDYEGDTVTFGRFVGTRVGDELVVDYVHVMLADGSVIRGSGASTVEETDAGVRLIEHFTVGGDDHLSICVEER